MLSGKIDIEVDGFEVSPGVWIAEGAEVDPEAILKGPLYVGDYAKVEGGAELREYTVLGSNVVVKEGAFLHRAVIHDNVFIGPSTNLRGCVIGKNTDVMAGARIEEGGIVGDECVIEAEAYVSNNVKVYPFKTIEAGAVVNTSVIWESRGQRNLFGPRGVSGMINVEITPELAVRLTSAYATILRKGTTVVTARDASRAARTLKRAIISALTSSAINVQDMEASPLPVARFETAREDCAGGIYIRTTPGDPQGVDILFLDADGAELSQGAQRKLDRVFGRQEYRRAFPGEIAELTYPPRIIETYSRDVLDRMDMTGVREAELKIVLDCAGGVASLVLPYLLGRVGVDVLTMNNRLDEASPTETLAERMRDLQRLGELVKSSRAAFGVRFDPVGERISLINENGELVGDDRALLVMLDLVAAERRGGRVALPITMTRVAEQVCRFHGVRVEWTSTSQNVLTKTAAEPDVIFAGDGRGGFVLPEFSTTVDGIAAFIRLLGLVARTRLNLSQIDQRIPDAHLLRRSVPTPWAAKGSVMRHVVEAAGDRTIDTTDGVRVVEEDGRWVLVLPDPIEAVTHLWAEGPDNDAAQALLEEWGEVVEAAGS
jgi:mannose-1-phosphate guanylyltransferase/phosphomannomutase